MTHLIIKALVLLTVLAVSTPAAADNGPIGGGPWKPTPTAVVSTLF
ncbi:hypothetical protein [Deinococcus rubellus]